MLKFSITERLLKLYHSIEFLKSNYKKKVEKLLTLFLQSLKIYSNILLKNNKRYLDTKI